MRFVIAIVLVAASVGAQQRSAQISGVVHVAGSDAPVRGATVRLTAASGDRWEATTDADGRYEFRDLPNTVTTMGATKAGYVSQTFALAERGIAALAPGTSTRVDIALVRGSVIAGRVFDHYGDPVSGVTVSALRVTYDQPGQNTVQVVGVGQTNDLGDYRVFGLPSGTYFVATNYGDLMRLFNDSVPTGRSSPTAGAPAPRVITPTFFPGTAYAADAQPVVLGPGEQALGADVRMTNAGAVRVTGRVVDSFGVAIDDTYVVLSVAATTGAMPYGARLVMTDDAGMFVFPNLPPGEYQVQAVALATPLGVAAREKGERSTERGVPEFGSERVSAFGEVVDVQVQTQPGIEVKGVVTIDGMRINPAAGSQMRILATPARSVSNIGGMTSALLTVEAAVNPDGTFVLRNTAGHRRIRVTGLPAGSFVVRITAGGADVTDEGVDMRRVQATELGIELTMKPPVLNVQVVDPTGRPKTGNVVVFSEDRQLWTLFLSRYVVLRAATNGSLRIDDMPAGSYLIAPLHPADRANWADPAFLERLRPTATPVALVAGETRSVTLVQR